MKILKNSYFDGISVSLYLFLLLIGTVLWLYIPIHAWDADAWFSFRNRIFITLTGSDNWTPISVPSFIYAINRFILSLFVQDNSALTLQELYAASFSHHLAAILSCLAIYFTAKLYGLPKLGIVLSLFFYLQVQAVGFYQYLFSENFSLPMTAWIVFLSVWVAKSKGSRRWYFYVVISMIGVLLGLFTITRVISVAFIPPIILFWYKTIRLKKFTYVLIALLLSFSFIIIGQICANKVRFGRFELSNSSGRRLWNAIAIHGNAMVGRSSRYKELTKIIGPIEGNPHWEVTRKIIDNSSPAIFEFFRLSGSKNIGPLIGPKLDKFFWQIFIEGFEDNPLMFITNYIRIRFNVAMKYFGVMCDQRINREKDGSVRSPRWGPAPGTFVAPISGFGNALGIIQHIRNYLFKYCQQIYFDLSVIAIIGNIVIGAAIGYIYRIARKSNDYQVLSEACEYLKVTGFFLGSYFMTYILSFAGEIGAPRYVFPLEPIRVLLIGCVAYGLIWVIRYLLLTRQFNRTSMRNNQF